MWSRAYIPLARLLARRYRHTSEPLEDLVQIACLGLVKAAGRWDPDRGPRFGTYAGPVILGELRRHFRDATWHVRPPRELQELWCEVMRARVAASERGRDPSVGELAARVGRAPERVAEALVANDLRQLRSLDRPEHGDDPMQAGRDDRGFEHAELRATVERLTARLGDCAREVLRLRFEEDLRQREIAERIGCSQVQVSRILRDSFEQLREAA